MKLRCVKDSIRLRLSKSDTRNLLEKGQLWESLEIGPGNLFSFGLCLDPEASQIEVSFKEGKLHVSIPFEQGESWINSQEVGIQNIPAAEKGQPTAILIEKDFPCKTRTDEDKGDRFGELVKESEEAC